MFIVVNAVSPETQSVSLSSSPTPVLETLDPWTRNTVSIIGAVVAAVVIMIAVIVVFTIMVVILIKGHIKHRSPPVALEENEAVKRHKNELQIGK